MVHYLGLHVNIVVKLYNLRPSCKDHCENAMCDNFTDSKVSDFYIFGVCSMVQCVYLVLTCLRE